MSLRLGRRDDLARLAGHASDTTWITTVVPWSPASIWPSLIARPNCIACGCDTGWDLFKDRAVNTPLKWAGLDPRFLPQNETPELRRELFYGGFDWDGGDLPRLHQESPLLTADTLNEAGVLDRGQVSTRFNIVDLESAIRTGGVGILTIRLAITRNEQHICFSYGLATWLLQDLASYRYARSLLLSGTLKCEGGRHEAKSGQ